MDPPAHAPTFSHARALRSRRLLLGTLLSTFARAASLDPQVLEAVGRGEYDPRSLHVLARWVLGRQLDLSLEQLSL